MRVDRIQDLDSFIETLNTIDPDSDGDYWTKGDLFKEYVYIHVVGYRITSVWRSNRDELKDFPESKLYQEYDPNDLDNFLAKLQLAKLIEQ